jgi:uncharacterized protein (UPF0333 family)
MSYSKKRNNNRGSVSLYSLWFAIMVVVFAVGFIYIVNSVIKEGQIVNTEGKNSPWNHWKLRE